MEVRNVLTVYEVNGTDDTPAASCEVVSHRLHRDRVVLRVCDGDEQVNVTVMAADLEKAVRNATNVRR